MVAAERLKSFLERVEALEEEKRGVADQIKEVYAEMKGEGYDAKVVKQIVRLRRLKPHVRAEMDELLQVYKTAVGMA